MAWNWPRISPEDSGELSAGKLGSRFGVDISKLRFVFRQPVLSLPARQAGRFAERGDLTPRVVGLRTYALSDDNEF
jgi:hypothetical protein